MINKKFDDIKGEDIKSLIKNKIPEDKTIEYKRELPKSSNQDIHEFLADVSAFVNASGGDLIYGIEEEGGIPSKISRITGNMDQVIQRLENLIKDSIEPSIVPAVQIKAIPVSENENIILLRISKSYNSPHRVKSSSRFYIRKSNGKYQMDVSELRIAFLLSETISDKIKKFRDDRISKIISDETPIELENKDRLILHIIPIQSFYEPIYIDLVSIKSSSNYFIPLLSGGVYASRFNIDGLLRYDKKSYCQIFRKGIIEFLTSDILFQLPNQPDHRFFRYSYEKDIIDRTYDCFKFLNQINILPPYIIFISILGIYGTEIYRPRGYFIDKQFPIKNENLILPEVIFNEFEEIKDKNIIAKKMKFVFDIVWNAYGFPYSFNYNDKGEWEENN